MRGIVLCNKGCESLCIGHMRLIEGKRVCALHYTLSGDKHIYGRVQIICCVGYYIGVDGSVYGCNSLCFKFGQHGYFIFIIHCKLKRLRLCRSVHLLFEYLLRALIVAVEERKCLLYPFGIVLRRNFMRTRSGTAADMIVQTFAFGFCRNCSAAKPYSEQQLNGIQDIAVIYASHKGAEVFAAVLFDFTRYIK